MGSDAHRRLRLAGTALLWAGAGALALAGAGSPRLLSVALLLALAGLAIAWPLTRAPAPAAPCPEPPNPPDSLRLAALEAWLEHLPVAAWVVQGEQLHALTARARRLLAPGGVRAADALKQRLRGPLDSGPLLLDTERGTERWQLRQQALTLAGQPQTLRVLLPLEHALESESLQAWQQLVKVLTHEIMNSLTPIRSLSQTARTLLDEPGAEAELHQALEAISQRADSLGRFVQTYRRVSHWPEPQVAPVDLQALLARLQLAVTPAWQARGGNAHIEPVSPGLWLQADAGQLEQALLALLHNAEQATQGLPEPQVWLQARAGRGGRLLISVRDNGPGVPTGLEQQIFLPFFSAREGGQGIGLTVVRQLVHGMGGRVRHVRPLEGGAAFVLSF